MNKQIKVNNDAIGFRGRTTKVSEKALSIIDSYFGSEKVDLKKVDIAAKMVGFGVKIEHINQIKEQGDKSLALRLMKFLPDKDVREKYIKITNPEVAPLLESRPK